MNTSWFTYGVFSGALIFLVGLLAIGVNWMLHQRLQLAVDDPTPRHQDDLVELLDAVKGGAMLPPGHPLAGVHRGCAEAWDAADYHNVGDCCFDLLGRFDVGLTIFDAEVTQ